MENKHSFNNFRYHLVFSPLSDKKCVEVLFDFDGRQVKHYIYVDGKDNAECINKAKYIIGKELKSGKLAKFSKKYIKGYYFVAKPILITLTCAIAASGLAASGYFAYKHFTSGGAIPKYTLVATCYNGTVAGNKGKYKKDEDVALTFTANQDYVLPASIDDIQITGIAKSKVTYSSVTGSLTFKMPNDAISITVTAIKPVRYTLTAICDNGIVKGNKDQYIANEDVALTFTANEGYLLPASIDDIRITGVPKSKVTYSSATGNLTFKMPAGDVTIKVIATEPTYTLTAICDNGIVKGNKDQYIANEDVALTFTANEGYLLPTSIDDIEITGIDKSKVTYDSITGGLTFKMPIGDVTITVNAIAINYTLTAVCNYGTVTGNKGQYIVNEDVALTFTADEDYGLPTSIDDIEITGIDKSKITYSSVTGSLTFKMPAGDVTITVTATELPPWYLNSDFIYSLTENDIGITKNLKINGIKQRVRLIDVDHDDLASGNGEAHTTWEFVNLLSDSEGYSLATVWNWEAGGSSNNQNYFDSNLRKAFDGDGSSTTTLSWYQKGSASESATYKGSVLSMFPADLQGVIKEVKKPIATGSGYGVDTYDTKVFPLSYREMTATTSSEVKDEGSTYTFYKGKGDTEANRIKHQIKWHDGAATTTTEIKGGKYNAISYAGFNSTEKDEYGATYWLRSPNAHNSPDVAAASSSKGELGYASVYGTAYAVAPAFCI